MKLRKLAAVTIAIGLVVAAAALFLGDSLAAGVTLADGIGFVVANPALLALRTQHTDLTTRAAALREQITDATPPAEVTRLETEHANLVRQAGDVQTQITAAERAAAPTPAPAPADVNEAIRSERVRVAGIQEIGQRAALEASVIQTAISNGTAIEAFRAEAFNVLAQRSNATRTDPTVSISQDEQETRREAMGEAIVARLARAAGERNVQIPERARAFGEMGFVEMAAECIGYRGSLRTSRHANDVMERAFHTLSDFPGIFQDAINRRLLNRYQTAMPTYRRFAALYTATDFRPTYVVRAGDFPTLQAITESGEIKQGTFSESKEVFRVYPYGVGFNLSRQMIINDNLRAIDQLLGSAGDRVTDWENGKAFEKLNSNSGVGPTLLTDSTAMFHAANHGNYTSTGTAISITSLGVGRAAMMKQTSLDGLKLNLAPATILTGPDRLTEAEQLVATITPASVGNAVPDWIKRLTPVGDANVTGNPWWLFADPAITPNFVYGYLEGFEGPRLKFDEKFGTQGIGVQLEHDFGIEGIDYRGGYKNNGAAPS
jgi:hypothetical protein